MAAQCMLNNDNNEPDPNPFYVFLSGGAGVGKTYLVSVLIEYLKRSLLFPGQNVDECPSVAVTASTGKAAFNVNGTTLHSAFSPPIHDKNFAPRTELKGKQLAYLEAKLGPTTQGGSWGSGRFPRGAVASPIIFNQKMCPI